MLKIKISKDYNLLILFVCIITVFISNIIALNIFKLNELVTHKYIVILVFCLLIAIIKRFKYVGTDRKNLKFLILWTMFISIILISKIINDDSNILDIVILLFVIPVFFFIKSNYQIEKYINLACIINLLPLMVILKNGNTIGIIITFIAVESINMKIRQYADNKNIISYLIMVLFFAILIFITKSRTSLITFLIIAIINYIYLLIQKKSSLKMMIGCSLLIILLIMSSNTMISTLFDKYNGSRDDLTSGRSQMWEQILDDEIPLLGNNNNYFMDNFDIGDAHNVYFQLLGHYGIIALSIYFIINIYIIIKIWKKDKKLEFINFFLCYFIIGMFENILLTDTKLIMCNILLFTYLGILLRKDEKVVLLPEVKGE